MVGQSKFSHQAGADVLPLRDAFAVLFFVSVGMLFDFHALGRSPLLMVGALAIILVIKPLIAFAIVVISGRSARTALTVAGGLAQIGEFSFILAELAKSLGLMRGEGHDVLVASAIVSITLNPFIFRGLLRLEPLIERSPRWQNWRQKRTDARAQVGRHAPLAPPEAGKRQAIVVGHGPVGQTMTRLLRDFDVESVIIEMNIDTVSELRAAGQNSIFGDATHRDILTEAGIKNAAYLVLTLPDSATRSAIIRTAREMNPGTTIFTRARYLVEKDALEQSGVKNVCFDEAEIAAGLARTLLLHMGVEKESIEREIPAIRAAWNGASDSGI
jgi:CPA2 family monovalent cation:H+ antiporter-2